MKNRLSSAPRIAFALLVLVTLACGASAEAVATEPAEPALLPDMSVARIFRQQLPGGFEELSTEAFFNEKAATGDEDLPEVTFAYIKRDTFQLIVGMSWLLEDSLDQRRFGRDVSDARDSLKDLASALGGQNIRDLKVIRGMESLGETQSAITMLADMSGELMRIDAAIFQRDMIGAVLMSATLEGEPPRISLQRLGELFDTRIQESLEAAQ